MKEIILYNQDQREIFRCNVKDEDVERFKENLKNYPDRFASLRDKNGNEALYNLSLISKIVFKDLPNYH